VRAFLRRRLVDPLKAQLAQGVTPGRLALAVALGFVLGAVPVLGISTFLCLGVAAALKLNQPAIQVANYAAYPVQLALLIPFFQAGAWLFGRPPVTFTVKQLKAELHADRWGTITHYAGANLRAVAAWALVAPVVALLVFVVLRKVLTRTGVRPASPPEVS